MTILKAHFANGGAFLDHYLPEPVNGGIFFPTRKPLAIGEAVVVSVRLGKRRSPMLLRGVVLWRRPGKHSTKTKAGIGIEFLATEAQTRDYLVGVARGDSSEQVSRRHQRLPVELPVTWQVPGALQDKIGTLLDIGRGGAFVRTTEPLPDDIDVVLKVSPPRRGDRDAAIGARRVARSPGRRQRLRRRVEGARRGRQPPHQRARAPHRGHGREPVRPRRLGRALSQPRSRA
jgi:Tfp pilus assembly protein PilZ